MANFAGGSAYAMVRDIADGYHTATARSFKLLSGTQLDQLSFELDRLLRELRGSQPSPDDLNAVQLRHRRLQRLTAAKTMLGASRQKSRA